MLLTSPIDLFMPTPLHLLVLLATLAVLAFRAPPGMPFRRWRYPLLMITAWCWLASTPVLAHWLGSQLENIHPPANAGALPHAPVILVLASGGGAEEGPVSHGAHLDLASLRRTIAAVEIWRETGGILLFSGAAWPRESRAVADRMAALAREFGVPDASIRVESGSLNTFENVRNSLALLEPGGHELVLVTSALHMPRAMAVAHRQGVSPLAAPADFRSKRELTWRAWWPNSDALPLLGVVLHEWVGLVYYALRGWI